MHYCNLLSAHKEHIYYMYNTSHLCPSLVDSLSSLSWWRRLSKGGLSRSNRGLWISRRCLATSNSDLGLVGGGGKGGCRLRPTCDNRVEQTSYCNESCQIWQWIVCIFSYSKQRNLVVSCIQFSFWPIDFFALLLFSISKNYFFIKRKGGIFEFLKNSFVVMMKVTKPLSCQPWDY